MLAEYIKKMWKNGPLGKTSVNATALNHIEQGVYDNRAAVNSLDNTLTGLQNTVGNMASDVNTNTHDIAALQQDLDDKFDKDGGSIYGNVSVDGNIASTEGNVTAYRDVLANTNGTPVSLIACFTSVSSGKALIAATLTDKGVETAATDSFATMAENIGKVGKDTVQYLDIGLSFVPDQIIYPS